MKSLTRDGAVAVHVAEEEPDALRDCEMAESANRDSF